MSSPTNTIDNTDIHKLFNVGKPPLTKTRRRRISPPLTELPRRSKRNRTLPNPLTYNTPKQNKKIDPSAYWRIRSKLNVKKGIIPFSSNIVIDNLISKLTSPNKISLISGDIQNFCLLISRLIIKLDTIYNTKKKPIFDIFGLEDLFSISVNGTEKLNDIYKQCLDNLREYYQLGLINIDIIPNYIDLQIINNFFKQLITIIPTKPETNIYLEVFDQITYTLDNLDKSYFNNGAPGPSRTQSTPNNNLSSAFSSLQLATNTRSNNQSSKKRRTNTNISNILKNLQL
jgi:hypothetical protein